MNRTSSFTTPPSAAAVTARFILAGIAQAAVTLTLFAGIPYIISLIYPDAVNGIASLLFGPIVAIITIVLSLGLGVVAAFFCLRSIVRYCPWPLLVCLPFMGSGAALIARNVSYPHHSTLLLIASEAAGILLSYLFIGLLCQLRQLRVLAVCLAIIVTVGSIWLGVSQFSQASQAVFTNGLEHAGYTIYVPPAGSGYTTYNQGARDYNDSTNYREGANLRVKYTISGQVVYSDLLESKAPSSEPTPDCGQSYLYPYAASSDAFTCSLTLEQDGMKVYKEQETGTATTIYYFAIKGGTLVFANITPVQYSETVDDAKTVDFFKSLQPLSADFTFGP